MIAVLPAHHLPELVPADLLKAWETAMDGLLPERALSVLHAAHPGRSWGALCALSVGARDAALLDLREALFGRSLECVAKCAHCTEPLEFTVRTEQIRAPAADGEIEWRIAREGYDVRFRLPNGGDLLSLSGTGDAGVAEKALFARCVVEARAGDEQVDPAALPDSVKAAVAEQMAEADPQGETVLDLSCPACGERFPVVFDIVSYVWIELDAWARRMLREVHALASAYGWREEDILALSPVRRRHYLDLVAG